MDNSFVLLMLITFSSQVESLSFRYIGCYKMFSKGFLANAVVRSANECWNYCDKTNFKFAALKNTSECYCGNTTDYTVPSSNCNLMCSGNINKCGGLYFYSIYLAQNFSQPNYIGCYRDNQTRDMTSQYDGHGPMTNDLCFNYCSNRNYTYMATQYYYSCYCDNKYGGYGVLETNRCNTLCYGNQSQICGGGYANSVYTACYSFALNKTCSQMYHCDASVIDVNGRCSTNKCINGWKGTSCNQRDCNVQNGLCDQYQRECKEFIIGDETLSECVCKEGYESTSLTIFDDKNCTDIDECKLGMCNLTLSNCTNTIGSYKCTCKKGFVNSSPTICEDIDECKNHPCNEPSQTCLNTFGSYTCNCSDGYFYVNSSYCNDIDECNTTSNKCDVKTTSCYNFPGSYNCSCNDGYTRKDNFTCNDLDECETTLNNCDIKTASCYNFPGSYNCSCKDGYTRKDNFTCSAFLSTTGPNVVGPVVGTLVGLIFIAAIVVFFYFFVFKRKNVKNCLTPPETRKIVQCEEVYDGTSPAYDKETRIKLDEFEEYFESHRDKIAEEFNRCPSASDQPQYNGTLKNVALKNRFLKMFPYDNNRVKLKITPNDSSDYINASFVTTYGKPTNCIFIAAQGPKEETIGDFWRMAYEQDVHVIVMVTKCFEEAKPKCAQYWPEHHSLVIDEVTIKLEKFEKHLNYESRTLRLEYKSDNRQIFHFLYTAWPDKDVPKNVFSLLNLHHKAMSMLDQTSRNKVIIHCSAGVGRTGTFIALDYLMRQAEEHGYIDIYQCMKDLREQRISMIQTISQYELCHKAMIMFYKIGRSTYRSTIEMENFKSMMKKFENKENCASEIERQFEVIQNEVGNNEVKMVNKASIVLSSGELDAVYAPNYKVHSSYVIGKLSNNVTSGDLIRLFVDQCSLVIFLDFNQNSELECIPKNSSPVTMKEGVIQLCSKKLLNFGCEYSFQIDKKIEVYNDEALYTNTQPDNNEAVYMNKSDLSTFLHITKTNMQPMCFSVIANLHSVIKPYFHAKEKKVVTILSRIGYEDAGYLVAALNLIGMMENFNEVDVYETVFELRNIQPKIINTQELYSKLYSIVKNYVKAHPPQTTLKGTQRGTIVATGDHIYANYSGSFS